MLLQLSSWKTSSSRPIIDQPKKPFLIELPASYPELLVYVNFFLCLQAAKVLVNLKTKTVFNRHQELQCC